MASRFWREKRLTEPSSLSLHRGQDADLAIISINVTSSQTRGATLEGCWGGRRAVRPCTQQRAKAGGQSALGKAVSVSRAGGQGAWRLPSLSPALIAVLPSRPPPLPLSPPPALSLSLLLRIRSIALFNHTLSSFLPSFAFTLLNPTRSLIDSPWPLPKVLAWVAAQTSGPAPPTLMA